MLSRFLNPAPTLDVLAYTARAWRGSVTITIGQQPLTSPPMNPENFPAKAVAGRDVLYFKLHGLPKEPRWYGVRSTPHGLPVPFGRQTGEVWQDAIDTDTVARFPDLGGAVVFAQSCYAQQSPMIQALLDAGASAVVGSSIRLEAGRYWPAGTDWLVRYFLQHLGQERTVEDALHLAHAQSIDAGKIPSDTQLALSIAGKSQTILTKTKAEDQDAPT